MAAEVFQILCFVEHLKAIVGSLPCPGEICAKFRRAFKDCVRYRISSLLHSYAANWKNSFQKHVSCKFMCCSHTIFDMGLDEGNPLNFFHLLVLMADNSLSMKNESICVFNVDNINKHCNSGKLKVMMPKEAFANFKDKMELTKIALQSSGGCTGVRQTLHIRNRSSLLWKLKLVSMDRVGFWDQRS